MRHPANTIEVGDLIGFLGHWHKITRRRVQDDGRIWFADDNGWAIILGPDATIDAERATP
jgi:hypothetical protein